jgi:hypothetical protein
VELLSALLLVASCSFLLPEEAFLGKQETRGVVLKTSSRAMAHNMKNKKAS